VCLGLLNDSVRDAADQSLPENGSVRRRPYSNPLVCPLLHVFGLWLLSRQAAKENIEQRGVTRCFPEGRKNLVFNFGFLIGKHTNATLARKLFVVPVLVYLYAIQVQKVHHFNQHPIKFCSWPLCRQPDKRPASRKSRKSRKGRLAAGIEGTEWQESAEIIPGELSVSLDPFEPKNIAYPLVEANPHTLSAGLEVRLAQVFGGGLGRGLPIKRQQPTRYCSDE